MSTQLTNAEDAARPRLPIVRKRAYWHNESGLIVSIFARPLPLEIVEGPPRHNHHDLCKARRLLDKDIYYGFYPRRPITDSTFFEVLGTSDEDLATKIFQRASGWGLDLGTLFLDGDWYLERVNVY
ncbi:hypothetical protein CPB83DRAFT_894350 [Crepidotus variabilis]|uniref:Uncharacterized protein n=1 Tax=Crepidotus variabilis TaxID=179855 RepID=A0A9P6EGQ1_9AGAR|nr:hypothetical protein CPB83DRAFT_894350 [Crepidotus variabilis]